ncbi:hypothetical protein NKI72_13825 [Mesorhizobium sp. M0437]|uniref:hypothetical protein n=1 Tax=Mesorhizobium sp. M0437 TaxID=2956945 RepID=UPI00333B08AC
MSKPGRLPGASFSASSCGVVSSGARQRSNRQSMKRMAAKCGWRPLAAIGRGAGISSGAPSVPVIRAGPGCQAGGASRADSLAGRQRGSAFGADSA